MGYHDHFAVPDRNLSPPDPGPDCSCECHDREPFEDDDDLDWFDGHCENGECECICPPWETQHDSHNCGHNAPNDDYTDYDNDDYRTYY